MIGFYFDFLRAMSSGVATLLSSKYNVQVPEGVLTIQTQLSFKPGEVWTWEAGISGPPCVRRYFDLVAYGRTKEEAVNAIKLLIADRALEG